MKERAGESSSSNRALQEKVAELRIRAVELGEAIEKALDQSTIDKMTRNRQAMIRSDRSEAILDDSPEEITKSLHYEEIRIRLNLLRTAIVHTQPPELPVSQYDRPIGPIPNPELNT